MILLNEERRLGRTAFGLLLLRKLVPGIIILVIACALLGARSGITDLIVFFMKFGGAVASQTVRSISGGVTYVVELAFAFAIVSLLMSVLTARAEYKNYTFTFEEFGLRLKRGMFRLVVLTIPYRQMQDVDVERGFFHQLTKTSRVVINSAGHEEPGTRFTPAEETNIVLDPIDKDVSEEIRLMLQRKIGVQVVEGEREADREAAEQSAIGALPDASPSNKG